MRACGIAAPPRRVKFPSALLSRVVVYCRLRQPPPSRSPSIRRQHLPRHRRPVCHVRRTRCARSTRCEPGHNRCARSTSARQRPPSCITIHLHSRERGRGRRYSPVSAPLSAPRCCLRGPSPAAPNTWPHPGDQDRPQRTAHTTTPTVGNTQATRPMTHPDPVEYAPTLREPASTSAAAPLQLLSPRASLPVLTTTQYLPTPDRHLPHWSSDVRICASTSFARSRSWSAQ
jgi:hypothetical protein